MKNRPFKTSAAFVVVFLCASVVGGNTVVCLFRAANAQAAVKNDDVPLSAEGMKAFRTLEKAGYFAIGSVGIASVTSESEIALRVLLKEKNGADALRGLFKTASPAGKVYALLGLRQIGTSGEVTKIADSLRDEKGIVPLLRGCIGSGEPLGSLAIHIETGAINLPPEQGQQTVTVITPITPVGYTQTSNASDGITLSAEGMQAFRTLENVSYFAVGGVGFAGTTSEGEAALRVLLRSSFKSV